MVETETKFVQKAPHAVASMVLGILSLLTDWLYIGLILGIIGLALANSGYKVYANNPSAYTGVGMLKAGKVTSIVGIVFGSLYIVISIILFIIIGSSTLNWLWS